MATFFGEVVQETSRAFWDGHEELDEDVTENTQPVFKLDRICESESDSYDYIIIAADNVCSGFCLSCLMLDGQKHIATIVKLENNVDSELKKQQTIAAELHQLNKSILFLNCKSGVDIMNSNDLLLLITSWLERSKEVVVLVSKSIGEYKSLNPQNKPALSFCRALKTKQFKNNILCPGLECPNSISGFSASVLSWCALKDQSCVLYVYFYSDILLLNRSINIEPLLKLCENLQWFKKIGMNKSLEDKRNTTITIKNVVENSNLYL